MKHLKALAVVLCAAAVLMAVGTGTASATTACTVTQTPCLSQDEISNTQDSHFKSELTGTAVIEETNGFQIASCTQGFITGDVENTGGAAETFKVTVTAVSWGHIIMGGCEKFNTNKVGTLEFHKLAGTDNATATGKEQEITIEFSGVTCTYGTGSGADLGTLIGGAPASLNINVVLNKTAGGFLCFSTVLWTANYTITQPTPIYIEP